ncbi:MAG TPA: hypothetical protein VEX70_16470 [Pyrinomonadaceae bacterium]|nr:hypothetical protein [Pyrinomonadaceae bacterium]
MGVAELAQLSLGHVKAEEESDDVRKYFITTPTYINATNESRRKTYYVGQRGAGKTALFNKLASDYKNKDKSIILQITPDDFSYERFNNAQHNYSDMRAVYGTVWHYTLITHMFAGVVDYYNQRPYIKANRYNVDTLRAYLKQKNAYPSTGFLGIFLRYFGEFTSNKDFNNALKVGTGELRQDKYFSRLTSLADISDELNAFSNITDSYPVCLFIDELDTGWDNSKEATNFIHGLFYAVREVKSLRNVKAFVSLRSDMYNDLSSILPDPEKMREEIERFSWNPKTLQGLIAKRIIANYPLPDTTPFTEAIATVFDEGVLDYIINHSLQRPREVIEFCTAALNEFSNQIYFDRTLNRISFDIVKAVEGDFSKNRYEDTCREYEHQYPDLHIFLLGFENGPKFYSMSDFKAKLEDVMLMAVYKLGVGSWLNNNFSPSKLVEILYAIGFIKLYSQRADKYVAYYEETFLNVDSISKVRIHEVFVPAMKCL